MNILPKNWKLERCQNVIDVRDGTHDTPKYVQTGIPLITSKNINENKINFEDVQLISQEDHEKIKKRSGVDKGDILYAMIGTVGNPVIVDTDKEFSIKNVALFKFKNSLVYNKFFYYLLNSSFVIDQIDNSKRGGNQKFVALNIFRDLKIPLPPLDVQKKIATVLEKADHLRQKRREALEKLDRLVQSVFLDMFGDPVTNPKGWAVVTLDSCCKKITDGTHQPPKFINKGIPFIFVANIINNKIHLTTDKYISEETYQELTKGKPIEMGDILYTTVGSYGNPAIVENIERFCFQRHIAHLKPDISKVNSVYLFGVLKSSMVRRQVDSQVRGIAQKTLNLRELKNVNIFLPHRDVQEKFANTLTKIEDNKRRIEASINQMNTLFNSLIQRAFRGDLKFNDSAFSELGEALT